MSEIEPLAAVKVYDADSAAGKKEEDADLTVVENSESALLSPDEEASETESEESTDSCNPSCQWLMELYRDINRTPSANLRRSLKELNLNKRGTREVLRRRLKNFYSPYHTMTNTVTSEPRGIDLNFIVALDFVFIQSYHKGYRVHQIVEFNAGLITVKTRELVSTFWGNVKPFMPPEPQTPFTYISSLDQIYVNADSSFKTVLARFERWMDFWDLGDKHSFCVATVDDRQIEDQLRHQCELSRLPLPVWSWQWMNVSTNFSSFYQLKVKRKGLIPMMGYLGVRPRSEMEKCQCLGSVVTQMLDDGCPMKINACLDPARAPLPDKCLEDVIRCGKRRRRGRLACY